VPTVPNYQIRLDRLQEGIQQFAQFDIVNVLAIDAYVNVSVVVVVVGPEVQVNVVFLSVHFSVCEDCLRGRTPQF
jgi:hypothetical protein